MAEPPQKLEAVFRGLCANCKATLDVMLFASPGRSSKCKVHVVRVPPRERSRSPPPPALPGLEYPPPPSQEAAPTCPGDPWDQPLLGPGGLLEQAAPPPDGADGLSAPPGGADGLSAPPDGADGLSAPPAKVLTAEAFDSFPETQGY